MASRYAAAVALARRPPRLATRASRCCSRRHLSSGPVPGGSSFGRCIVIGGSGALGAAVVQRFAASWHTTSVDFHESATADANVLLEQGETLSAHSERLLAALDRSGYDVVVHAAGGWAGSDPGSGEFPASLEFLWSVNVESAALAAQAAGDVLRPDGMLILTGAHAAAAAASTQSTPTTTRPQGYF